MVKPILSDIAPVLTVKDLSHYLKVHPSTVYRLLKNGQLPAFRVGGMLVWGFTAALVDRLLTLGGWEQPWDHGRVEELPPETLAAGS